MSLFDRFADWVSDRWSSAPWFSLCVAGVASWVVVLVRAGLDNEVVHLWLNSPTTALTFLGVFLLHNTTHRFERDVCRQLHELADRLDRIEAALEAGPKGEPWLSDPPP